MTAEELSAEPVTVVVDEESSGQRLDAFLAAKFSDYSRVHLRRAITAGGVNVGGRQKKASYRIRPDDTIEIRLPEMPHEGPEPEDIPLDILFEDEHLVAVNKPPAMVVHPARGHWAGTLASALAFHFDQLSTAGGATRPGIVHRLDRDTSGVLVVAKSNQVHLALAQQFEKRTTEKEYFGIVRGVPDHDRDSITKPIGSHPHHRERMAIREGHSTSRTAHTFYEVTERFAGFAALRITPKTGRTHQIRVHLAHIGCPVVCDRFYGSHATILRGELRRDREDEHVLLGRQALHAQRLKVTHPITQQPIQFEAPLPADILHLLEELRTSRPHV